MATLIDCKKLKSQGEALERAPYPGELGQRIQAEISQQAWQMWMEHQTMLINEYRLNLMEDKSRAFLEEAMQKFLFEDSNEKPEGYVPPEE